MKKIVRILVCDPSYSKSVNRVPMILRIKFWQKNGLSVSIFCSSEGQKFYQEKVDKITYYTFPFDWKSKEYFTAIIDYIRVNIQAFPVIFKIKSQIDIVYSLSSTLDLIILPFIMKLNNPKIRWYVNVDNTVPKPSQRPGNLILKTVPYLAFLISNFLLKKADSIFVVVNFLKEYYEKRNVKVIRTSENYGIEENLFRGNISPNTPKFNALFGARLHPAKGIYDLVDIIKLVVDKKKNFTLGIMGDGVSYHKNKLTEKIQSNSLGHNITLLGYKNGKERGDLYRNCDLFLFPSYAEGMTISVLEAFAANKLVISYDLPEYRDAFKKYIQNGQLVLFPKGNIQKIANYIISGDYERKIFHNNLINFRWEKVFYSELFVFLH